MRGRRTLAGLGMVLGFLFVAGVLRSVLVGESDWWSAIIVLPVLYIVYRLYSRWLSGVRRGSE